MLPGVGVFGTSLTARVIIPLLKNEGFAVKALWGRTQEEAEELAKEMNVPFYTNRIDDVLLHQDVDLVCINLPPPLTRQIAVKTLDLTLRSNRSQTCSMGLRSGLFAGHGRTLTFLSCRKSHTERAVWLVALSCWRVLLHVVCHCEDNQLSVLSSCSAVFGVSQYGHCNLLPWPHLQSSCLLAACLRHVHADEQGPWASFFWCFSASVERPL
ncbi:unnamed protein product [Oncorhynchus mykiss]|uniref:Gfo/Idh/MocA-like oxidoreductase N-terminal domain-containing protein n=1 Tax=Oncorhynchus mykiss TaxID=8022 RepID=A0A060WT06_ONCMY|nr:unnamed protein product [Oncorhynchus mykiss]